MMLNNRFGSFGGLMDGLMDGLFAVPFAAARPADSWRVRGDGDGAEVEVDLPGFSRDEIEVSVEGDSLTITARREGGGRAGVSRAFRLLDAADPEAIEASLKNGVLTVRVGKSEKSRRRQIEVNSEED